jgi:class 3 adenylate cyclase
MTTSAEVIGSNVHSIRQQCGGTAAPHDLMSSIMLDLPHHGTCQTPATNIVAFQPVRSAAYANATASEPRLTVILAADTVGYTRQMAEDEAGMHAACTQVRLTIIEPGIALHGARIVKHTGDGFLAEFPSATRAVWFAITFQDSIRAWNAHRGNRRRLEFRIGINLGDVFVEPHDVFGHSVNVAARLEESAKPGGVLVSQSVAAAVRDSRLQFDDAGDLMLRHVDEPVQAFHARFARRRGAKLRCVA